MFGIMVYVTALGLALALGLKKYVDSRLLSPKASKRLREMLEKPVVTRSKAKSTAKPRVTKTKKEKNG